MMSRELPQSGVPSIFEPFALKQKINNTHRLIMNRWAVCAICTFQGLGRIISHSPYYAIGRNIIIIPPKGLLPKYKFSVRRRSPFCMDSDFHIYIDIFRILVVNSLDNSDTFFLKRKGQPHRLSFILIRSANRLPMHPSSTLRPVVEHRGVEPLTSTMRMSRATAPFALN